MDFAKEDSSGIQADAPREDSHQLHQPESRTHERAFLDDFFKDAIVYQIEKLRDDSECGDPALVQRLEQFGCVQS